MTAKNKILVPGGTGAFGMYLIDELLNMGYYVDVVSLDDMLSSDSRLRYIKADFKDENFLDGILKNDYDGIIDFMIYSKSGFEKVYKKLLSNCGHYIFLSSYRVYADEEHPITEQSPRLLDVSDDKDYLKSIENEYSLYKAQEEDILKNSGFSNWTIVRPSITFSKRRFQLTTLEANNIIPRKSGKNSNSSQRSHECAVLYDLVQRQCKDVRKTYSE